MYTVDLGRRELVRIDINLDGSAGAVTRTAISAGALGVACAATDVRPFGLGVNDAGVLHVGAVCSGESTVADPFTPLTKDGPALGTTSSLAAWVFSFDGGSFTKTADVPVPLGSRGSSVSGGTDFSQVSEWRPWVNKMPYASADLPSFGNTYPQPIVSDIEFDGDDMIIGLMDRWAHQTGANAFYEDWSNATQPNGGFASEQPISSGDLVRGNWNGSGFDFPQSGVEYTYSGDNYSTGHAETAIGGVVQIPGRPYVIATTFDPNEAGSTWQSGGLEWFDNSSGGHVNGARLYNGRPAGVDVGTFEKAAGIGDVQASCGSATIQIGNRVWFDSDNDGIADPGESPMAGIELELVATDGSILANATTDGAGLYLFDNIAAHTDLKVRVAQSNYDGGGVFATGGAHVGKGALTSTDQGGDDTLDSDAMIMDGLPSMMVNVDQTNHSFDIGFVRGPLRLGNRVWLDQDGNGSQNGSEPGIADVEVQLWSVSGTSADALIGVATTDGNGFYKFENLFAGDYIVAIADTQQGSGEALEGLGSTVGNGTAPDPDDDIELDDNGDPAAGFASISQPVTLSETFEPTDDLDEDSSFDDDDSNLTIDFGFVESLRLGNLVWEDLDGDGVADDGEPGIVDVTVQLWTTDGSGNRDTLQTSTDTDSVGHYEFAELAPGDYIVAIADDQLAGFSSTSGNGVATDPDDNLDNDDDGDSAPGFVSIAQPVTLASNTEPTVEQLRLDDATSDEDGGYADNDSNLTVDFGFVRRYRLGNLVWFDSDNDGLADDTEAPLSGVDVELWSVDLSGNRLAKLATQTTGSKGRYLFEDLDAGEYILAVPSSEQAPGQPLAGYTSSTGNDPASDPDDGVDNDDDGAEAAGFAAISSPVTLDSDTPVGEHSGLTGVADENGSWVDSTSDLTIDFGFIGNLRLGNRVWLDENGDGSQNDTEPGIAGAEVQLWSTDSAGARKDKLSTTITDSGGHYTFSYLAAGDYVVAIAESQQNSGAALAGLGSTSGNGVAPDPDDDVDLDDDGDPAPGFASISSAVTVSASAEPTGEANEAFWIDADSNLTVDFGFLAAVELGNLVWFDADNDGEVDSGEAAASGVKVNLVDTSGNLLSTATTDSAGHYLFGGLAPGSYRVEIPASEFAAGEPLEDWHMSTGNRSSSNPNDDVDDNNDGFEIVEGVVRSGVVTVTGGGEPTDEVDETTTGVADADSNLTLDFGFYQLSLGNLVWFDDDNDGVKDPDEKPAAGVVLLLVDTGRTATTNADGEYLFDGLAEGTYRVKVLAENRNGDGPLEGTVSSTGNNVDNMAPDPDDDVDSDDNGDPVVDRSTISKPVTLSAGDEPSDNHNGTLDFGFTPSAGLGAFVWFDDDKDGIQDPGEKGVPGITVTVYNNETGAVGGVAITDADGAWRVDGLAPGDYYVQFTDPDGRPYTAANAGSDDGSDSDVSSSGRSNVVSLGPGEFYPSIAAGIIPASAGPLAFTGASTYLLLSISALTLLVGLAMLLIERRARRLGAF
ncbi:MAG: SdrD B-like domain-containing protein [Acidimicrobiales bacterium]